jgi:hypothetical protein
MVIAMDSTTSSVDVVEASSTHHTPPVRRASIRRASSFARRVFPHPPDPVSVTSRPSSSRFSMPEITSSWPKKAVSTSGRFEPIASVPTSGGNASGRLECVNCHTNSGRRRPFKA